MKNLTTSLTLVLVCFMTDIGLGQNYKFGKVSEEELQEKYYAKDSTASAAVLYRNVYVDYHYVKGQGFQLETQVQERVKIYNKDGFDYATKSEALYKGNGSSEAMIGLKAFTYYLKDGQIEKSKLEKSGEFLTEMSKRYDEYKFTLPNIQEGCVVEYQYTLVSPYIFSLDEIDLQYDIPIAKEEIEVRIPEFFVFKKSTKGYVPFNARESTKSDRITFMTVTRGYADTHGATAGSMASDNVDYLTNVTNIDITNVPALKEEPFVNSMDNYRAAVNYELQYIKYPNRPMENYTGNWEKVVKTIYDFDGFGGQLNNAKYARKDLESVLQGTSGEMEVMFAVYNFVKARMNWNGLYGYTADEGVKKAYDQQTGNVADINLMLVAILREAGLKADPVLVSTRNHGVPLFPTLDGFNYVAAAVNINDAYVFLDATNKFAKPNMMPTRTINWLGRIVREGGTSKEISLMPPYVSTDTYFVHAKLTEDGSLEGKVRHMCHDYAAYAFRNALLGMEEESYLEKLEAQLGEIEISDYEVKDKGIVGKPIVEEFGFFKENGVEVIGDKIYLSPFLWMTRRENPLQRETRDYPIDYTYPWADKCNIMLQIPEGYKVESMPEPINLAMEGGVGHFLLMSTENSGFIQIKGETQVDKAVIPAQYYPAIKAFYRTMIEKQSEKIVLSKI